jgi:pentatricopeptide repeat protein
MVAGYAQNGQEKEAKRFFNQIHQEGMKPNELAFVSGVNACVILMDLKFGK